MSRKKVTESETIFAGFSDRLKKIRGGLSQEELGKIIGVTKATISRYESGRIPDVETLKKLADYGGVTVEWLLRGEARPFPPLHEYTPEEYLARRPLPLDTAFHTAVIQTIKEVIASRRLKLSITQESRLIALVYEHCRTELEKPTPHLVEKYLLLTD